MSIPVIDHAVTCSYRWRTNVYFAANIVIMRHGVQGRRLIQITVLLDSSKTKVTLRISTCVLLFAIGFNWDIAENIIPITSGLHASRCQMGCPLPKPSKDLEATLATHYKSIYHGQSLSGLSISARVNGPVSGSCSLWPLLVALHIRGLAKCNGKISRKSSETRQECRRDTLKV